MDNFEKYLFDNEKEWRKHILEKLDKIEANQVTQNNEFGTFKVKTIMFLAAITGGIESVKHFFIGK